MHNEVPVPLPGCGNSDFCSFEDFEERIVNPHLGQEYHSICSVKSEVPESNTFTSKLWKLFCMLFPQQNTQLFMNTCFLLAGPQLVQMFIGDGAELICDALKLAKEKSPCIIFVDEIDTIRANRFNIDANGDREVQRTVLDLLNQLDGFTNSEQIQLSFTSIQDLIQEAGVSVVPSTPVTLVSLDVEGTTQEQILAVIDRLYRQLHYICRMCKNYICDAREMQFLEFTHPACILYPGDSLYLCTAISIIQVVVELQPPMPSLVYYEGRSWEQTSITCRFCNNIHVVGRRLLPVDWIDPLQPALGFRRSIQDGCLTFILAQEVEICI